jgi:hypothetical protein
MRRALALLVTVACSCRAPSASPPPIPTTPAVAPAVPDAGATPAVVDDGPGPAPSVTPSEIASEPPAVEADDPATPAKFGQSLTPGLYVFPDGFRVRVEQLAGCDFDTSVPCYGGTYRARATLGKAEATVQWSTRSALVLRHRIEVTQSSFTVRR